MHNEFWHEFWHFALAGGVLSLALLVFIAYRIRHWVREGNKLQEVGYITPRVTVFARFARWMITRLAVWLKVGRFTVLGRKHLKGARRKMILINHQIEHDAVCIPASLRMLYFRGLMAITQIVGYRKPIAAWLGVVPVHHDKNPMAAVRVSIKVLKAEEDSSMVAFPQGELIRNNDMQRTQFHAGAIAIVRMAGEKGQPSQFDVVPAGVYYDRDLSHATWLHWFLRKVGVKSFRSWFNEETAGVTVVYGEPIKVDDLPADKDAAMDLIYERIKALSEQARLKTLEYFGEVETAVA